MKKNLLIMAVLLLCTATASAQLKFGLKAGVNLAEASLSTDVFKTSNMTGFQVGPTLEFMVPMLGVGLDASLLYSQQGFKLENADNTGEAIEQTIRQNSLDIPVNFKYKFSIVVAGAYLSAGPYARFNLSNNLKNTWDSKSFGAGLNFGAGIELLSKLQLGINYQLGLTDDYGGDFSEIGWNDLKKLKGKSRVWSISATYFF